MSTSPHEGVILYDPGDFDTDEPLDTALVRDALLGSALHKADEAGQVRAAWCALNGAITDDYLTIDDPHGVPEVASASEDRWYAFPIRIAIAPKVRADRTGYRLRVWLAGASSDGDRVDFGLLLVPRAPTTGFWSERAIYPLKRVSNITSTVAAELALDDGMTWIDVPAELIAAAAELAGGGWITERDIGGAGTTVPMAPLDLLVLGQTWNAASVPRLYGVHAAEYIGP